MLEPVGDSVARWLTVLVATAWWAGAGAAETRIGPGAAWPRVAECGMPDGGRAGEPLVATGFATGVLGGYRSGVPRREVISLDDRGPGSLREALRDAALVTFGVSGEIVLRRPIDVPGGSTIDGRGASVTLVGKGLRLGRGGDVVVTHLDIRNVAPDNQDGVQIGAEGVTGVVGVLLDCLTLRQAPGPVGAGGDEAVSVVHGARDVTLRRSEIAGWDKAMLLGLDEAPRAAERNMTVTLHDNVFRGNARRHPRARHGRFDIYNNAFLDWRPRYRIGSASVNRSYGILCENGCRMRLEHNLFAREASALDRWPPSWARQASRCAPAWFNPGNTRGRIATAGNRVLDGSAALEFGVGCALEERLLFKVPYERRAWRADRR